MVVVLVWQAYRDEQTRKLIKAWTHSSVTWLSSGHGATERGSTEILQVFGEGPINLVLAPFFVSNVEHFWEDPDISRWLLRLASLHRGHRDSRKAFCVG